MNKTTVIDYIKVASWAIRTQQFNDLLSLSPDEIVNRINQIIKEEMIDINIKGLQPDEHILQNMQSYDTTQEEAEKYETHCHNCGTDICVGEKYCGKGCFKFVEEFNYDCFWGKSCKMCNTHREYIIMTRNFEINGKTYWIDNENRTYQPRMTHLC